MSRLRAHSAGVAERAFDRRRGGEHPEGVLKSAANVTTHMAEIIDGLDGNPVIVGHSFGGLTRRNFRGRATGPRRWRSTLRKSRVLPPALAQLRASLPALGNPTNRHKTISLTKKEIRFGFGNAATEEESDELFERWTIPSPAWPLFEAAAANFSFHSPARVETKNEDRGPLCSFQVWRTTRFPTRSLGLPSSNTVIQPPSPNSNSSRAAVTR